MSELTTVIQKTEYTIEELNKLVLHQPHYFPVSFVGDMPMHLYQQKIELPGEVFRKGWVIVGKGANKGQFEIEASNFGRVRSLEGKILEQEENPSGKDYLCTYISTTFPIVPVHRIVASLWCTHPEDTSTLEVHHITNNGYDNRPCNLLWIGDVHSQIKHKRFS